MDSATRERRTPRRIVSILATIGLVTGMLAITAHAKAAIPIRTDSYISEVRCAPDDIQVGRFAFYTTHRSVNIVARQRRLTDLPIGYEYGDRGFYLYNKRTGVYDVQVWSPQMRADPFTTPFGFYTGAPMELHGGESEGIQAAHYTVSVWFAWWVWDLNLRRWVQYQQWVESPTECDTVTPYYHSDVTLGGASSGLEAGPALASLDALSRLGRSPSTGVSAEKKGVRCLGKRATIVGTELGERIDGTTGRDVIVGGGGDDLLLGYGGNDIICGGDGDDQISDDRGYNSISGDIGDDVILGGERADRVFTGPGSDIVDGRGGPDSLHGDPHDAVAYVHSPENVSVNLQTMTADDGWGSTDTLEGFSTVVGSMHDDTLVGSDRAEWFVPMQGDDDVLGSSETDVVAYLLADRGVAVDLGLGTAEGEGTDSLSDVEIVFGSPFDDTLTGSAPYNWLFGGEGNDTLDGVAGSDTIDGGPGSDECRGGGYYGDCENQGEGVVRTSLPAVPVTDPPPEP